MEKITVCDKCLTASCWLGVYMCWESRNAGTTKKSVKELRMLKKEHSSWWMTDKELGEGTDLRKYAKGKECQIRLPGICNFDPETTVLCHPPTGSGLALKYPDVTGAHGCSSCHDVVDGRVSSELDPGYALLCFYQGVHRTLLLLDREGILKW